MFAVNEPVTLSIAVDRGYGPIHLTETFRDAGIALAWLNGYLGIGDTVVTHFRATHEGDSE